jgi:hypothetical protein
MAFLVGAAAVVIAHEARVDEPAGSLLLNVCGHAGGSSGSRWHALRPKKLHAIGPGTTTLSPRRSCVPAGYSSPSDTISTPMPPSQRPRPASALGSASITRSASTRAWDIARRAKPTKQNARGYVNDRHRRPAAPSPTSPLAQPPSIGLMLTRGKTEAMPSRGAIGAGTEIG